MNESELNVKLALTFFDIGDVEEAKALLRKEIAAGSTIAKTLLEKIEAGKPPTVLEYDKSPEEEAENLLSGWRAPVNSAGPTYHIQEYHSGGLILDDERPSTERNNRRGGVIVTYSITDGKTDADLTDRFSTYAEAQAYASSHFADRERWFPQGSSMSELISVIKCLRTIETDSALGDTEISNSMRVHLSWHLHQRSLPPEIVARIKNALRIA